MSHVLSLRVTVQFQARMALADYLGVCREPHGYRFLLHATVTGQVNPQKPWLADLVTIQSILEQEICQQLDGKNLNDFIEYPSIEGILFWCINKLLNKLPQLSKLELEAPPRYLASWQK